MPGNWSSHDLPGLTEGNTEITSPETPRYNCISWAAGEDFRVWWPDPMMIGYWPPGVERAETRQAFLCAYAALGFTPCANGNIEPETEKIALFGKGEVGDEIPTHAALQLESGKWTSKLGSFEDIIHSSIEAVAGPAYGAVICYLSRPRRDS